MTTTNEDSITATYTIFDGDGSGSGTAWPAHEEVEVEGDDLAEVIETVRDALDVAAYECSSADGYAVGDTITAMVYHDGGTEFVHHTLTAEEIGTDAEATTDDDDEGSADPNMVTLETMPDQHVASHRAAGNWGTYPANGAVRERMTREDAEQIIADDEDGYAHIVDE